LLQQSTVASGNTCGATFWTDGKFEAPMLPDEPWLIACPHCHALAWVDELAEVGRIEWRYKMDEPADQFPSAFPGETPSAEQYFSFLAAGIVEARKRTYVRHRAWRAGNDSRRAGERTALSTQESANLEALLAETTGMEEHDRIARAEMLRELGRFEAVLEALKGDFDRLRSYAVLIRSLAERHDPFVARLPAEN
jgi:hypothetical protein